MVQPICFLQLLSYTYRGIKSRHRILHDETYFFPVDLFSVLFVQGQKIRPLKNNLARSLVSGAKQTHNRFADGCFSRA